ncbi:CaiB/BaiF CoA transferase family protein [Aestuariispira ectoiniformans]|uniref:CaiB/BaiF CoA transferase family protein n=1 Tax=Aestuariispira ectoiniformans TaxID=2775080 RepID=UPI00223B72C7|nr:CaiB/BaiF CoA-transferase family protein [Aestuariispira ectoiniformans]
MTAAGDLPLSGIRVIDFSTLLPGPLASLILAEAGAEVLKIERPETGEDMRHYPPFEGKESLNFALLNRGKTSITADLKSIEDRDHIRALITDAHIVVDQFRPGVLDRLGLGYEDVRKINPAIVYCAITGNGQDGPDAQKAGHDLNYMAESGLLSLAADASGAPVVPPGLIADIGGGAYPAVMNILLALRMAEKSGKGCKLDISMTDNLGPWMWWAQAHHSSTGQSPRPGGELLSGGSPRYQIYQTQDGRYLAVAALEQKFWDRFCDLADITEEHRKGHCSDIETIKALKVRIAQHPTSYWRGLFDGEDVCCSVVATYDEAVTSAQANAAKTAQGQVSMANGATLPALPLPLDPQLRHRKDLLPAPQLPQRNRQS